MDIYLAGENYKTKLIMDIYLAGEHDVKNGKFCQTWQGLNILESFVYARNNKYFPQLATTCENLMLDSGAFTFLKNRSTTNFDKYTEDYADFINKHNIDLFFELDIDPIVGLDKVEHLRNKLEQLTRKKPIPVWHKNRGKQYFIDMCIEYPYVAIGGIALKEIPKKIFYPMFNWFIKTAHENNAKIHGLGFSSIPLLKVYKFDSVDSKALISGNLSGVVYRFYNGNIEKITKSGYRLKSFQVAKHNFNEWVKFSKYAKINL